jgi:hypothetical protein
MPRLVRGFLFLGQSGILTLCLFPFLTGAKQVCPSGTGHAIKRRTREIRLNRTTSDAWVRGNSETLGANPQFPSYR